jgi:hypothetical protein
MLDRKANRQEANRIIMKDRIIMKMILGRCIVSWTLGKELS